MGILCVYPLMSRYTNLLIYFHYSTKCSIENAVGRWNEWIYIQSVVFDRTIHIMHGQGVYISQRRHLHRLDVSVSSFAVALRDVTAVEGGVIKGDIARVAQLLRRDAQQLAPYLHLVALKRVPQRRWIRQRF